MKEASHTQDLQADSESKIKMRI